ncbi:MAG TPA: hypothetical protein VNI01_02055 [Elusimicrobiota bacterium]|nr:hypothetical protein [Elusimicrobiota bacterium]
MGAVQIDGAAARGLVGSGVENGAHAAARRLSAAVGRGVVLMDTRYIPKPGPSRKNVADVIPVAKRQYKAHLATMTKKKEEAGKKEHVAVRLTLDLVTRLDALLPRYALPGRAATRSDGLRAVIIAGLEVEEQRGAS